MQNRFSLILLFLMTAERVWARINASAVRPNYGQNSATLIIGKRQVQLVGVQSLSADPQHCQRQQHITYAETMPVNS